MVQQDIDTKRDPVEKELDVPLALADQVTKLKQRVTHLETLESSSVPFPSFFNRANWPAAAWIYPLDGNEDISRRGNTLSTIGSPGVASIPYLTYSTFDGVNDSRYVIDANSHNITTDSLLTTFGYFTNTASVKEVMFSRWNDSGAESTKSYQIYRTAGGVIEAFIRDSGGTEYTVTGTTVVASGKWVWIAFRVELSTELSLWIGFDGGAAVEEDTNTTSIPASINTGSSRLSFGGLNDSGTLLDDMAGRLARSGKSDILWADAEIEILYNQEKQLLGF